MIEIRTCSTSAFGTCLEHVLVNLGIWIIANALGNNLLEKRTE